MFHAAKSCEVHMMADKVIAYYMDQDNLIKLFKVIRREFKSSSSTFKNPLLPIDTHSWQPELYVVSKDMFNLHKLMPCLCLHFLILFSCCNLRLHIQWQYLLLDYEWWHECLAPIHWHQWQLQRRRQLHSADKVTIVYHVRPTNIFRWYEIWKPKACWSYHIESHIINYRLYREAFI